MENDKFGEKVIETEFAVMDGYYGDELEGGNEIIKLPVAGFYISGVHLKNGIEKGLGYGQEIYIKALKRFGVLYSAYPTSDDAIRVQNKLLEKGIVSIDVEYFDGIGFRVIKPKKLKGGGSIEAKGTFSPIGSAKELGITPKIAGHDMVAQCDCGEKFSYENANKNILWQCPECKGMKRISITKMADGGRLDFLSEDEYREYEEKLKDLKTKYGNLVKGFKDENDTESVLFVDKQSGLSWDDAMWAIYHGIREYGRGSIGQISELKDLGSFDEEEDALYKTYKETRKTS